jgi:hypothetical protein
MHMPILARGIKAGCLSLALLPLAQCQEERAAANTNANAVMSAIDLFRQYISGDFDNSRQVEAQREAGQQIHPFARHVNRVADHKVRNRPANRKGFFLLEESYYDYPGKDTEIKPYLFFFEGVNDSTVRLQVYRIPDSIPVEQVRNDNPDLFFDYETLSPSPSFQPADYQLRDGEFHLHAPNELGGGMRFTLIETIGPDRLEVMELLEKDEQRLTPYDTPIIYDRL